ncbi:MAG TPA: hypothetical protein PKM97_07410 [Bacteroidia bacterium]|nr:hypothetical protein [Bacteroidia bacterium]
MSLSKEQKQELGELSRYLKKIEELTVENNIDLDVFMSEYKDSGFAVYATEKVAVNENAQKRKRVYEKSGKTKESKSKVK